MFEKLTNENKDYLNTLLENLDIVYNSNVKNKIIARYCGYIDALWHSNIITKEECQELQRLFNSNGFIN